MLVFGLHAGERMSLNVDVGMTVREVREMIQVLLNISVDQYRHDKKVLVLSWAGSDLKDPWIFSDLGIVPGSTIRVNLREEVKPVLHIRCSHSQDTISLYDNLVIGHMYIHELRGILSRKTGLPVGIFRLVTTERTEMYDGYRLEDYGIDVGHTILLENLDGWNEFLNLAILGFTPQVVSQISPDEIMGRYQMKVALFLAAHFGHVDLARAMLRQGVKASEPVDYPPQRMWCTERGHVDSRKAAVHQAVEMGQLGVLRLFVNNDITVITAKDGNGLAPLNIALRKKIKNCASFLLTKQWSKVNVTKTFAMHIGTYTHLRQWCERAKERAFMVHGPFKSSLKRRPFQSGPLVGFGVNVDGFSPSIMTGKSKAQLQKDKDRERKRLLPRQSMAQMNTAAELQYQRGGHSNSNNGNGNGSSGGSSDPEAYFKHVNAVQSLKSMGDKVSRVRGRFGRLGRKASVSVDPLAGRSQAATEAAKNSQRSPEPPNKAASAGEAAEDGTGAVVRLPPIMQKLRSRLMAQSQSSITSEPKDPPTPTTTTTIQQQPQQQAPVPHPPSSQLPAAAVPAEKKEEKSMMSKLVKSRGNAYFMAGGGAQPQQQQQSQSQAQPQAPQPPLVPPPALNSKASSQPLPQQGKVPSIHLPQATDRSEVDSRADTSTTTFRVRRGSVYGGTGAVGAESLDTASTITTGEVDGVNLTSSTHHHHHLSRRYTHQSSTSVAPQTSRQPGGGGETDAVAAATNSNKTKKKPKALCRVKGGGRVTSALLLSKAKASEGSIPLPLISHEQDRRPFFYYNGKREDAFIEPTISTWSKHTRSAGATPRERAIQSLSVANTFKDKPWLGQMRIALQIAANPTKRNVRRLRSAAAGKRAFAIQ